MNTSPWAVAIVVGLLLFALAGGPIGLPVPAPPPGAPDLLSVFAEHSDRWQASQDAGQAAELLDSLARIIEWDGTRSPPKFATDQQLEELRVTMREFHLLGGTFGQRHPLFGPTCGDFLAARVGLESHKLDPAQRRRWVSALRDLAAACQYASRSL